MQMTESIKISLVTGGTRGIGSVIADELRYRGDHVITVSRRTKNDENHISVDLSSKKQISQISKSIGSKQINNLIFCHRYRGDNWGDEFQVSLGGVYFVIENIKKKLASVSSIVMIGSNASRYVFEEQSAAYHASRAALENITRYYAVQLGSQGTRCNCILPGGTLVKPENVEFFSEDNPVRKLLEEIRPLRKMGDAKDIAYLVEFLCSNKASFITGQSIFVDGGLSVVSQESLARKLKKLQYPNDAIQKLKTK